MIDGATVYEVVVHHNGVHRDDRCIVARFLTERDAKDAESGLCIAWVQHYGLPPPDDNPRSVAPCPN